MISMALNEDTLRALDKRLKELKDSKINKINRSAVTKASRPLRNEVKRRARAVRETGTLEKSITSKVKTYPNKGIVMGIVGPDSKYKVEITWSDGTKEIRQPSHYAHLVEMGSRPHKIVPEKGPFKGRTLHHPGAKKQPFMRPAFDAMQSKMVQVYRQEVAAAIEREAKVK
jgi:HK97 gp10 family phage protein